MDTIVHLILFPASNHFPSYYQVPIDVTAGWATLKQCKYIWHDDAVIRLTFKILYWQLEQFFVDNVLYASTVAILVSCL